MRKLYLAGAVSVAMSASILAQSSAQLAGPSDPKAQKTYETALEWQKNRDYRAALDSFKKADKQDGDHCLACQKRMMELGQKVGDYKIAEQAAREVVAEAKTPAETSDAHVQLGIVLLHDAARSNKDSDYTAADTEFKSAQAADAKSATAYFADGIALAHLKQDDAAKQEFQQFAGLSASGVEHTRALRYIERPELARARMTPAFAMTTVDGKQITFDDLAGKVVLIDFWATWCGPCREALPHVRRIAKNFAGEPLVVISVSLDTDDGKWRSFISQNQMTWLQARADGFTSSLPQAFGVNAIPHTFTIDADGVLQDEHVGDASIEGKLKKLCEQAKKQQEAAHQIAANGSPGTDSRTQ